MVNFDQPVSPEDAEKGFKHILKSLEENTTEEILEEVKNETLRTANQTGNSPQRKSKPKLDTPDDQWKNLPPIEENSRAMEHKKRRPDLFE